MKYLLDTNALIWYSNDDEKLSAHARSVIADVSNEISVSIVSFWEIMLKSSMGKLPMKTALAQLERRVTAQAIHISPIRVSDLERAGTLPYHHKDPFDRLIIATALEMNAAILSTDGIFDSYGVAREW